MDAVIDVSSVAILVKIETTEGVDAAPVAADAIPFEKDGYSYNYPFKHESSNEANGTKVAAAPLVVGQPADLSIKVRLKGANAAYTSSVKPPHHALLSISGKRGLFTTAVAAAALTAGSTTSATLGASFSSVAQTYRGMPLILSGAQFPGAMPFISDYTAGKVATLTDVFGSALGVTSNAAIPANWTYAGTSPRDPSSRLTDEPSGTVYIYEGGVLLKFVGCRGALDEFSADTAKPGFATFKLRGIFAGKVDASIPSGIATPAHSAPTLVQGLSGVSGAFMLNRLGLPISKFSYKEAVDLDSPEDPNTFYGFGPGQIGGREPMLTCDPLATLVATRDTLGQIAGFSQYPGVVRFLGAASNRIGITHPILQPVEVSPELRAKLRAETVMYRAIDSGFDPQTRNSDMILCFH
jgi:hypothetical protein